jgi:hypothetical protein
MTDKVFAGSKFQVPGSVPGSQVPGSKTVKGLNVEGLRSKNKDRRRSKTEFV